MDDNEKNLIDDDDLNQLSEKFPGQIFDIVDQCKHLNGPDSIPCQVSQFFLLMAELLLVKNKLLVVYFLRNTRIVYAKTFIARKIMSHLIQSV